MNATCIETAHVIIIRTTEGEIVVGEYDTLEEFMQDVFQKIDGAKVVYDSFIPVPYWESIYDQAPQDILATLTN